MRNYIWMAALFITAAFVNPSFLGESTLFILKILLFGGFIFFLYQEYKSAMPPAPAPVIAEKETAPATPARPARAKALHLPAHLSLLLDANDGVLSVHLNHLFDIGYAFLHPTHGYFLLEEKEMVTLLTSRAGDLPLAPRSQDFKAIFALIKNRRQDILIENHLKEEIHLNNLYDGINYSPGSIFIQKININEKSTLYWIFDAKSNGFFNEQDLDVMIRLGSLSREAVDEFIFRIEATYARQEWQREKEMYEALMQAANFDEAVDVLIDRVARVFEAHKLTVCARDTGEKFPPTGRIYKSVGMESAGKAGQVFPLEEGLVGRVMANGKTYLLEDIEKGEYFIPRFSKKEKTNFDLHAFLGMPYHINDEVAGAIVLEHKEAGKFTAEDSTRLKKMIEILEKALKRLEYKKEADK